LQRIGEEDSSQAYWPSALGARFESVRFDDKVGPSDSRSGCLFPKGGTFRKIELPDLPEANIPEKLKHGKKFPHVASLNWQEAKEWKQDGSLVVTIDTMIDGEGSSITATRTVVLGFDRDGKARIVK
jgi:hypothetical protein